MKAWMPSASSSATTTIPTSSTREMTVDFCFVVTGMSFARRVPPRDPRGVGVSGGGLGGRRLWLGRLRGVRLGRRVLRDLLGRLGLGGRLGGAGHRVGRRLGNRIRLALGRGRYVLSGIVQQARSTQIRDRRIIAPLPLPPCHCPPCHCPPVIARSACDEAIPADTGACFVASDSRNDKGGGRARWAGHSSRGETALAGWSVCSLRNQRSAQRRTGVGPGGIMGYRSASRGRPGIPA